MSIISKLRPHLKNLVGKSVKEKYLIIESDDWGSIRMPSRKSYERLYKAGVQLGHGEAGRYNLYDSLASSEDLEALFNTLRRFRDHTGRCAVFTVVSLVANPDFDKIRKDNFASYHYEPFTETLNRYGLSSSFQLWRQGYQEQLFIPEFHAREHLNVPVWMRMLQKKDRHTLIGFEEGCWGFECEAPFSISYQASFDPESIDDLIGHAESIRTGLSLFEEIHRYPAKFFVAPNGPFHNSLEEVLAQRGIRYIGASKVQLEPQGAGKFRKHYHWLGKKNKWGQCYLTRNAFFEPNAPDNDWVSSCLNDIHHAFLWSKPAVISSHRTNYIGGLYESNRKLGLQKLDELLTKVMKRWPEVRFVTSSELGSLIEGKSEKPPTRPE